MSLPAHFGLVVLSAVANLFHTAYLGFQVGQARKKFGVKYPQMYDDTKPHFNCYQRAHQNTLEYLPILLTVLFLGGLSLPVISALGGLVWVAGRYKYAVGYQTGNPELRLGGGFAYAGLLACLACTFYTALTNL